MTQELSRRWRQEEVYEALGIKQSTYYNHLSFLGIQPSKDSEGTYLTSEQMQVMEKLSEHIRETGKKDGFPGGGQLVVAENAGLGLALEIPLQEETEFEVEDDGAFDGLMREAAVLRVQQEVMPDLVKLHLAANMTDEDLPEDLRIQLEKIRKAANPRKQNPATVAQQLLERYRSGKSQA